MSDQLPEYIDPWRLADRRSQLRGQWTLDRFARLRGVLADSAGTLEVELDFSVGVKRRPAIEGKLSTELALICQRCMQVFLYPLQLDLSLVVVESEDECDLLPEDVDPVLAQDGRLNLLQMVEDEILLAIPQAPLHKPQDCNVKVDQLADETNQPSEPPKENKKNPFEILTGFKAEKT